MGLKAVVKYVGHQTDGWKCGYYATWYLQHATKAGEKADMAALQLPDMDPGFTARFQTAVHEDHVTGLGNVDIWLAGTGGTGHNAPPKVVKAGDRVWVARQYRDGAGKSTFAWDEATVVGGSQNVVQVKFRTHRRMQEVPLRHIRTAPPPRYKSDSEVEVVLPLHSHPLM